MTTGAWRERGVTPQEAAILFHPDRRSPWAPSIVAHLSAPLELADAARRLRGLAAAHPILDARLDGARWIAGSGRLAVESAEDVLPVLRTRFDLVAGAPVRVALAGHGTQLVVVGHHAALDGRALVEVAAGLLGVLDSAESEAARATPAEPARQRGGARETLRRLARPGDRVAPSAAPPRAESFVARDLPEGARIRASALAAAAAVAAGRWNAARGAPWERVGLTIPVGGPPVLGNVSTHRRVDVDLPGDLAGAVTAALAARVDPPGAALSPRRARLLRALAPLTDRLSDSLLVSNLGRVGLPGVEAVDFYPQARGRSAVALGACTPMGGRARLTLRARDLTPEDADALLGAVVAELAAGV